MSRDELISKLKLSERELRYFLLKLYLFLVSHLAMQVEIK
jgi:hypothetical protein